MARQITTTVYKFDELPPAAQQKAIAALAGINVDYEWWGRTYEDAERVGVKIKEFDIDHGTIKAACIKDAEFTARAILTEHGTTCDTYIAATAYLERLALLTKKLEAGQRIEAIVGGCTYGSRMYYLLIDLGDQIDNLTADFAREIRGEYLSLLRQEFGYKTSDEAIVESIRANEYEFTADGQPI